MSGRSRARETKTEAGARSAQMPASPVARSRIRSAVGCGVENSRTPLHSSDRTIINRMATRSNDASIPMEPQHFNNKKVKPATDRVIQDLVLRSVAKFALPWSVLAGPIGLGSTPGTTPRLMDLGSLLATGSMRGQG